MRKSLILARSNLKRAKGQTLTIAALVLLAALMLNLWLMLSTDYKKNFDRYHDALNSEHVTLSLASNDEDMRAFVSDTLDSDSRTAEVCVSDSISLTGMFNYNGGEMNGDFVFMEKDAALTRSVGRAEIVQDSEYKSGIYLPLLYSFGGSYQIGDTVEIKFASQKTAFTLCGFFNSIMTGSHNCSICMLILTADEYARLAEQEFAPASTLFSVRISDKKQSADYEAKLKNSVSSEYPDVYTLSNSYELVSSSRFISQMICSGIVSAMAFLVALIAIVVIASNVINYVQDNMKNLGALKAMGYTGRQLILSLLFQFVGVALITSLFGAALSYALFPFLNDMMISQTGIPYAVRFLPLPLLLTLLVLCGAVALTVWLSARRIKKIQPITALRSGVETHSFKKNRVPLDRTRLPLNAALAFKSALSGVKQNIVMFVTMTVLSLVVVFSGLMTENVIVDMQPFTNLIVGETADSCLNVNASAEQDFLSAVNADSAVEKVYLYTSLEVRHTGGVGLMAQVCDDFSKLNNQSVCFKGRFPLYDNETAIAAKYAREKGIRIGDEISLEAAGGKASYIVTGFTQISNNLGKDCLLLRNGYERLGQLQNASYYINLKDGADVDDFNKKMSGIFGSEMNVALNILSMLDGMASVYVSLMTIIVIAVLVLSVTVIAFVLYLLVRNVLAAKKQTYGIMKALGFTTGQLVRQTALSFMPSVILSTVIGLTISALVINPLTSLFLSGIGIVKCTFAVPVGFIALAGAGIVALSFGIACLMSLKIRKIAPRALLGGE